MKVLKAIFGFLTNRIFILSLIVAALFYVLVARLFELQIIQGEEKAREFEESVVREVKIEGQRGNIYDRYGVPLAENVIAYNVLLNDSYQVEDKNRMIHELVTTITDNGDEVIWTMPLTMEHGFLKFEGSESDIRQFKKNVFNRKWVSGLEGEDLAAYEAEQAMPPRAIFEYMQQRLFDVGMEIVEVDGRKEEVLTDEYTEAEALAIINIRYAQYIKRFSRYNPETIAENVSEATLAELEEKRDLFPGVTIAENPYRVYNDAPYFAHIIGYTRDISADKLEQMESLGYDADDVVGFVGIEKELEAYLRGYDGVQAVEVNNIGRTMKVIEEVAPVMGNDVYLTIDHDLQIETYHILEKQMAEILAAKMYMYYPKSNDTRYVLLKDVYDSIFRYDLIDVNGLGMSQSASAAQVYEATMAMKADMIESITDEITLNERARNFSKNQALYYYILNGLKEKEFLDTKFYKNDYYDLFIERRISFNQLMQAMYEEGLLVIPLEKGQVIMSRLPSVNEEAAKSELSTDFGVDPVLTAHIQSYIFDDFLLRPDLDRYMYLYGIDEEMYNYRTLSKMIVDLGLVTATEEQLENLERRRLSPLEFMKEKILNIEITPQQLALDPSAGSVVITDVDTGEILALVSYPTYDNSRMVNTFDGDYYNEMRLDPTRPLYPRATMSRTVPGSTFKMLVGMAALEEGVIGKSDYVNATGYFNKVLPAAKCWIYDKGGSHGMLTVASALEVSCNYFFYEMGYRLGITESGSYEPELGITRLQDYLSWVGLDTKTGIEIGEADSSLPAKDPVRASIGQEQNGYTPVQLARYMNVIANDGEMRELNLVDMVLSKEGGLVEDFTPEILRTETFSQENIDVIKDGMLRVTQGSRGTARSYFADIDVEIAGKTGTAEIVTYDDKSIDPVRTIVKRPNHAVFTGFAPADDPEVSIVSVLQFAYGSTYAALNSKEVLRNYFDLERQRQDKSMVPVLE